MCTGVIKVVGSPCDTHRGC